MSDADRAPGRLATSANRPLSVGVPVMSMTPLRVRFSATVHRMSEVQSANQEMLAGSHDLRRACVRASGVLAPALRALLWLDSTGFSALN